MSEQEIKIDGVILPYELVGGVKYFPIRYTLEKVLLKSCNQFYTKEGYKPYINKSVIDWSFAGTVPQESNCMNKEGWIYYIKHCKQNKNKDINKIKRNNLFCDFLEYEDGKIEDILSGDELYDDYINDCIEMYYNKENRIRNDNKRRKCCVCGRELPKSYYFFCKDDRINGGLTNTCRLCCPNPNVYFMDNKLLRKVYVDFGNDGYLLYKKDIYEFYNKYIVKQNKVKLKLPNEINKIGFILNIIKDDYLKGDISKDGLCYEYVKEIYENKIEWIGMQSLRNNLINEYCSNNDCKIRPYLYPNYKNTIKDYNEGNVIFNTYINDNNIIIEDIFTYKEYNKLLRLSRLSYFNKDILSFIVQYYNYEYAGYKFKIPSSNYYKNRDNSIFDMKWFIEKDREIPIEKIPLYVTKNNLHNLSPKLYYALYSNKCFSSLYEWINTCYPNMYIENDFDMNPYRCEFDSLEESQIHDKLINNLTGVIYNTRNKPDTVEINGMIPDWIICNDKGCYLVEYFGLYTDRDISSSDRLIKYREKMNVKIEKYKEIEKVGYKTLFIYPDDIRNGFDGLMNKIEDIK